MKRLSLLTAAALLASTPLFAMDGGGVSISGEANFGVKFKEHANEKDGDPSELQFHHEFDIKFSASGTTDGGIGFGGSVSIDNTESVAVGKKGAKMAQPVRGITIGTRADDIPPAGITSFIVTSDDIADAAGFVTVNTAGNRITDVAKGGGANNLKLPDDTAVGDIVILSGGKLYRIDPDDIGQEDADIWRIRNADGTVSQDIVAGDILYKVGAGDGPMTAATAASFDPDASNKIDNHGEVYISMDMHKLTIGSDLDAADKVAGGLADPGFDGIGIDDVAEGVWGKSAADVRYDGDFGVASVAISYGDNKGDAEWAAGFSFNVEPVTVGAGFDSNGVMSIGMGFTQGQISMNALYSTDSDHDEADNEEVKEGADPGEKLAAGGTITRPIIGNKMDLKNQAMGVDVSYQMSEATSVTLVAAQHKMENAEWLYDADAFATTVTDVDNSIEAKWHKSSKTIDAFGIGFSHDLGGGATLKAGAGSVDSNAVADLGITMKF